MCKPLPFPRCASHARDNYMKALHAYTAVAKEVKTLESIKNSRVTTDGGHTVYRPRHLHQRQRELEQAKQALEKAKEQYEMTPTGRKELEEQLDEVSYLMGSDSDEAKYISDRIVYLTAKYDEAQEAAKAEHAGVELTQSVLERHVAGRKHLQESHEATARFEEAQEAYLKAAKENLSSDVSSHRSEAFAVMVSAHLGERDMKKRIGEIIAESDQVEPGIYGVFTSRTGLPYLSPVDLSTGTYANGETTTSRLSESIDPSHTYVTKDENGQVSVVDSPYLRTASSIESGFECIGTKSRKILQDFPVEHKAMLRHYQVTGAYLANSQVYKNDLEGNKVWEAYDALPATNDLERQAKETVRRAARYSLMMPLPVRNNAHLSLADRPITFR